ncbi:mucin-binding protein [Limosilactobacillus reuteri]|uniref:YSIRK-type signal peptide-containing protein n=1 Tax=Limosilactobacillus reuteri TaxID=1598 RepID=A0A347T9N2_LIMRT|nr:MucBP domain-containing protein [Limosilactobacillus reuteri]AXX74631.1 YSIRK-type signal peptide-containing protein [Limosilactobacillus reuteri]MRG68585.1 YSIRK-type signal peptide-containing protein [Limosilactobacillus reuteri]WLR79006.1 MucBP domain-containing protein [Limosilactobacillus reuteri]
MLSHKNLQEQIKKNEPTKQRFAIKKLSIGVASVLLGVTFAGTASADTNDATSTPNSGSAGAEQTDHNLVVSSASTATMKQATAANATQNASAAVVNPAGNIDTSVAKDYEAAVNSAASAAMSSATSAIVNNTSASDANQQSAAVAINNTSSAAQSNSDANVTQVPKTETFIPTTTPSAEHAIGVQGVTAQKAATTSTANENVNQTYKIAVKAVDVTTGAAPVTSSYIFNYNFKNGVFNGEGKTGTSLYSFGMAPTGYKLLNPEVLGENFTMVGNMARIKDKDVDITLQYARISPILVRYIDEATGEVLATSSVGANTSTTASYAYNHGDNKDIGPSKFLLQAIDIPGYQLDDQATFIDTYNNVQSKGNLNYQVHTFKYKKIMDNPNPKDSQKGSGAQYGEYFGPAWDTIDPADVFNVSGVKGLTYEHDNGDIEAKIAKLVEKYGNQGYTYMGTFNYHKNTDYYNWNEAATSINLIPNKPVTVKFIDEQGNKLADDQVIAFNKNNPDQTNDGLNATNHWYSAGEWHATPKNFDGYTLRTTYGADHGQFTPYSYVVTYEYAKDATAQVKYIDDTTNTQLKADDLKGYVGDPIDYSTKDSITNFEGQGYELVSDGFTAGAKYADGANVFEVHFKHGQQPVNPDHPDENVDPSNYLKDVKATVHYVGAGDKTPTDNVQTSQWSRTVTIDTVTHEIVAGGEYDTDWSIVPGQKTEYDQVATPVIDGFHADRVTVPATAVTQEDIETTITYAPNGKIIPVDPSGKPIPNVPTPQYPTDPTDPTAVTPDEPVPDIPGWVPSQPTVTPTDPGKDTPVTYNQIQKADLTIVDQDNNNQQIIVAGIMTKFNADGIENTKIDFTGYGDSINALEGLGYEYVSSDFNVDQTFDNDGNNDQHFVIVMKHGTEPVNPEHPGAGYNKTDLQKEVTRTINYVNAKTGAQVADPIDQTVKFTAQGTVDKVTGKLVTVEDGKITGPDKLTWTPVQDVKGVESPSVDRMHVVSVSRDADGNNVKSVALNHGDVSYTVTVSYEDNGTIEQNPQNIPASQMIKFVDENGNTLHENNVQTSEFTRTADVVDAVTGDVITEGAWNETSHKFGTINVPVIDGYVAEVTTAGGLTATTDNPNVVTEVVYKKVGKIIPVDPTGNPIPNAPTPDYPTDPTDPAKVTPNEPVPNVPGYTPSVPTVTPTDPGKDTPVPYNPIVNEQTAVVNYVDQDNNNAQIATSGNLTGKPGSVINYSTADQIKQLEDQGYVLVSDGFPADAVFDNDDNTTQTYTVVLKHGTTTFKPDKPGTPGEPINPNYPDGPKVTNEDVDYLKDVKFTVHYVGAGNNNPADNVQNAQWTRSITVDNVTGKIISSTEWVSNKGSYDGVKTPVVNGYHADRAQVEGPSVTMEDQEATVTYVPNGKIIPVDPNGNPIPDVPTPQYPTDPTDPTKVTPDEPVPTIPGYKPEVPTVTPTDPGVDTPVKYTPDTVNPKPAVDQIAIVNYVDQDNNNAQIATSGNLTGKAGTVINYSTADQIKELEAKGYVLVTDGFPASATFNDNADQNQVFTVVLKHGHAPVGPNNPHEPGTPVNPDEPNGPKWPVKDTYTKEYTSTVHFVDNNGNKIRDDDVQTSTWTRTLIIDKVTGQIINPDESWTADKGSYSEVKVPVINSYVADKANVPAKETVQRNIEDTVTYSKVGNIVPVDPSGNPIPNVPAVPYTNDPTDPTKVVPDEPVPSVPGMTPNVTTVTPTHPTVDTPVVYTTPTPVTPETPVTPQPDEPATPETPAAPEPVQPATPQAPAAPQAETPAPVKTESAAPAKQEAKKLPQTGNENNSAAALGLAALGLTGLLAAGKKRRKEE